MKKNRFFGLAGMVSLALTFAFVLAVGMAFVSCATDGGKTPEVNGRETPVEHPDANRVSLMYLLISLRK
jgi:hypothetical protein